MGYRILVVEDTYQVRTLIQKIVRHMYPDATVDGAANGKMALRYAVRNCPDLIITDLEMPEFDGFDLLKGLVDCADINTIPVVVVTSHADRAFDSRVTRQLADMGFPNVPVIGKPLDITSFTTTVAARMEMQMAPAS